MASTLDGLSSGMYGIDRFSRRDSSDLLTRSYRQVRGCSAGYIRRDSDDSYTGHLLQMVAQPHRHPIAALLDDTITSSFRPKRSEVEKPAVRKMKIGHGSQG